MRFLFMIAAAALWPSAAYAFDPDSPSSDQQPANERSQFFVHLNCSPQNARAVLSTLQLAKTLSNEQSDVTLFIDLQAVSLAETNSESMEKDKRAAVESLFDKLERSGVHILVCPHCAQERGIAADRIRKGARFTSKEEVTATTVRADKVFEYKEPLAGTEEAAEDSLVDT